MPLIRPTATFCDILFAEPGPHMAADVAIFSAAHGTPYKPGTPSHAADGYAAVRSALGWYSANTEHVDFDLGAPVFGGSGPVDCGEVEGDLADGPANRAAIHTATRSIVGAGATPILLGGDDSTPIPFIEALQADGPVTIVQVDAHIDWRDEVEGENYGFSSTMRRASEMANVTGMIQIGIRGPGSARPGEVADARAWGSKLFTARDVHRDGVGPALGKIAKNSRVILAIDVDGIDPTVVPGVLLPAHGGLTYQQMLDVILGVAERATIVGVNFVEYVPDSDPTKVGAVAIARLVSVAAGAISLQRSDGAARI